MPVRSLNSSVLKWPDHQQVEDSLKKWIPKTIQNHSNVLKLGYFGSYARGDWGVGSDLDLVAIVVDTEEPFESRSRSWDLHDLPVQTELIIYTLKEWDSLQEEGRRFIHTLEQETVWLYERE
jgi:predicted nucleotidyltransferase